MNVLALVPLDERPVCSDLPVMTAAVAGVEVRLPPEWMLPHKRQAGDVDAIAAWLPDVGGDAAVVSLEGLGLGGLVPSRLSQRGVPAALGHWQVLTRLDMPVYASVTVPRIPDIDDDAEEPHYWAEHGRALHRLSVELSAGAADSVTRDRLPREVVDDWLARRLRQHTLAMAAIGMAVEGTLQTLLVAVDDAAPGTLSDADARALATWAERTAVGHVLVQPGTDETGAVLVARALASAAEIVPRVRVECAEDGGLGRFAPFEVVSVGTTVERQVAAAGGRAVHGTDGDAVLVVHAPDDSGADWATAPPSAGTDPSRAAATAELVAHHLAAGRVVALADLGQPNGADPVLLEELVARNLLTHLAGYGAWNTAGNTVGSVVAHLVAGIVGRVTGRYDPAAHRRLLAHRLVEDWAWMSVERARLRSALGVDPSRHDSVDLDPDQRLDLGRRLDGHLATLPGFADLQVDPESVRLPWQRTYEVDFRVKSRGSVEVGP